MNVQSRDEALRDFREDSSIRVLLMSLKAGGVALNLTVANEAYLLDRKFYLICFFARVQEKLQNHREYFTHFIVDAS